MLTESANAALSRPRTALSDQLLAVLDAIADGLTVQDASGKLIHANTAAADLMGFSSPQELVHADPAALAAHFEILDEHGAPVALADLPGRRVLAGEDTPELLLRFRIRATGAERWASVRGRAMRDGSGERLAVNTLRDVTETVQAQTMLRASEGQVASHQRRLELALEAGGMGVFEWNIAENRVTWSPQVERIHGIPVGSFEGTFEAYKRDIHPEDLEYALSASRRTLEKRDAHRVSYRIIRPDGEVRWIEAHGRLEVDDRGNPVRLVGVCRDITDNRTSEDMAARALAAEAETRAAHRARGKLAAILEGITDPFTVLDRQLRVVHINDAGARLMGKTPQDLIGRRAWDVVPESKNSAFMRAYEQVLATGRTITIEEYFQPWDRWYEASIYPLEDGLAVYTRDVTVRKRAIEMTSRLARYAALRADISGVISEERDINRMLQRTCEALVEHLEVAFARVWTLDESRDTLFLQASAGMYTHINGAHKAVPVGKFKIGRIAATRKPHLSNDVQHDPQVGDPAWAKRENLIAFAGYPLIVDGRVIGVLAMFSQKELAEDTTSALANIADLVAQGVTRRRAEVELEHRAEDLARSNAELEQFAYVASHDLQEPLRMVASYNQLLARRYKGKLGSDADEFIGFTVEGVTRMQRLINDLLAYSRVGRRSHEKTEIELEPVYADVIANLERAIHDTGAVVTHDPLPRVVADPSQMTQLLQNLIGNAIKFHGDDPPKVHVGVREDRDQYTFSIRDNGIGIDPQYFERIFVIFQRLNPREKYPGTGIGLAICKKIVERHGGKIWVESAPGQGSTVLFTIPRPPRRAS